MEALGLLVILVFLVLVLVLPLVALGKSNTAQREVGDLRGKVQDLLARIAVLQSRLNSLESQNFVSRSEHTPVKEASAAKVEEAKEILPAPPVVPSTEPSPIVSEAPAPVAFAKLVESTLSAESHPVVPPPLPAGLSAATADSTPSTPRAHPELPPPLPTSLPKVQTPASKKKPELNLEQFLGVKMFAWLGGLALFFGVVFFVKYAVEHSWISPELRAGIGFLVGAGLLVAGVKTHLNKTYTVLAETFLGTGVLILYGVTFAAHSYWKIPLFNAPVAFGIMSLITLTAFLLSVRLEAVSISIMGMVGGFLTPILCSTGEDHPWALFGYIALLDVGLLAVARISKWFFLASLGAAGTILMQLGWFESFFNKGSYFEGNATWTPILIAVAFMVLFIAAAARTKQNETGDSHPALSAMALCASAMLFAFFFLHYPGITSRTWLLYGFVFFINAGVIAGVVINPRLGPAQLIIGLATFLHLAIWTTVRLRVEELGSALAVYFIFGALHSVFPIVWQRLKPQNTYALQGAFSPWFPPLTLLLMLLPVLSLPETSFMVWPAILLVDMLAIIVAVTTSLLLPVLAALVLTLMVALAWLFKVPAETGSLMPFLFVVGGFAAFFAVAGSWLSKRYAAHAGQAGSRVGNAQVASMLPVMSAALPFALLIIAAQRLPMTNPTPVFGLGLLLVLLQLGLVKISRLIPLTLAALGCMFALEASWHAQHFNTGAPWTPLLWYVVIYLLFAVYPFVFRDTFRDSVLPWATSTLAAGLQFLLIHDTIKSSMPAMNGMMGLVPAAFAVPGILGLFAVLRSLGSTGKAREGQLAWFGGAALFFITLIFPIQFDREWLTLSWALEGAALIWLFRRVPHEGLRLTGLALLAAAFTRLAVNPAVLEYHTHSAIPILNWYLYTYGIAAAAMFFGATWLREPHHKVFEINVRGALWTAGGILLFWLLNIEIADYFTPTDAPHTILEYRDINLGRDMTYSITWGAFALALILLGFLFNTRGARYAGIGLMAITLLKVFLHDLANLESIYRVAALIGVAVIALAASFLYQRFFDKTKTPESP